MATLLPAVCAWFVVTIVLVIDGARVTTAAVSVRSTVVKSGPPSVPAKLASVAVFVRVWLTATAASSTRS